MKVRDLQPGDWVSIDYQQGFVESAVQDGSSFTVTFTDGRTVPAVAGNRNVQTKRPLRRTELKAKTRWEPPRSDMPRRTRMNTRPSAKARAKAKAFAVGWTGAERCVFKTDGKVCGQPAQRHHVVGRAVGPDLVDDPDNRAPLCGFHNTGVESDADMAAEARAQGLKGGSSYEARNADPMAREIRKAKGNG